MSKKPAPTKKPAGAIERLPVYLMEADAQNLQLLLDIGQFENKAAAVRWALRVAAFVYNNENAGAEIILRRKGSRGQRLVLL